MSAERDLLLGEWACLGLLYDEPGHGFAVAELLRPGGELGRIWSLSRPLTYRSIDVLVERGLVAEVGSEPGTSGPARTMLRATRRGRAALRAWVQTPVEHPRDLRSALLLKLAIADRCHIEIGEMLDAQRARLEDRSSALRAAAFGPDGDVSDPVALWRFEMSEAGRRFLERIG